VDRTATIQGPEAERDRRLMQIALEQAQRAREAGEVPVGALVVSGDTIVGLGYNQPIASNDPSAHAEMIAIRAAAKRLANYRLPGCELFVTLEPCAMCAGVIQHSRLARVVYAASDPKTGVCGSVIDLFGVGALAHHARVEGGLMANEAGELLRSFFAERRHAQRHQRLQRHSVSGERAEEAVLPRSGLSESGPLP
jgi:tRNA(adenine34) deaminase